MFDISLQVRGTTKKGIALKALFQQNVPNDNHIPVSNTCIKCVVDVDENDAIQCSKCSKNYHITCLTHPIPSDFTTMQAKNPCLWWLCMACVLVPEKHPTPPTPSTEGGDEAVPSAELKDLNCKLDEFKTQLIKSVTESIDKKLKTVNDIFDEKLNRIVELSDKVSPISSPDKVSPISSSPISSSVPSSPSVSYANVANNKSGDEQETAPCVSVTATKEHEHVPGSNPRPSVPLGNLASPEVTVLSPINDEHKSTTKMNKVKKLVESQLQGTQTEFIHTNTTSMKVSIGFKNADIRDKGESIMKSDSGKLLSHDYELKSASKMLPKITLYNVSTDILDEVDTTGTKEVVRERAKKMIITKVLAKNECIANLHTNQRHTFDVVFLSDYVDKQVMTVGFKVSPAIRTSIIQEQNGTVYLGNTRYSFKDRYHVKICYHCQMLGHISKDCTSRKAACLYCMDNHESKSCKERHNRNMYQCARCLASRIPGDAENCRTHNGADPRCPVVVREMNRREANTDFVSKNRM